MPESAFSDRCANLYKLFDNKKCSQKLKYRKISLILRCERNKKSVCVVHSFDNNVQKTENKHILNYQILICYD